MDEEDRQFDELEKANTRLRLSLKQCRQMIGDYRAKLAANGNAPLPKDGDVDTNRTA